MLGLGCWKPILDSFKVKLESENEPVFLSMGPLLGLNSMTESFHLLCLVPALFLHAVSETPWFIKESKNISEWVSLFTHQFKVIDNRDGGAEGGFA
ncbi:unnamed protein product [Dovyalis caffra]|uniref:Uncharacterized protein n=1 Tax=Dovyalis caffra TaxID=77055 RepID=A0AAV1R286_9ROSI|nr:unnamed protein product [Dovyalis caffra]